MAKLKSLKSDPKKEVEGIEFTYPGTDVKVTIARLGNTQYEHASLRAKRTLMQQTNVRKLTETQMKDAIAPAVADHIIKGWKNLQDDDGKDMPFNRDNVLKVLRDRDMHDFYDWVLTVAGDAEAFKAEIEEDIAGNS